MRRDSPGGHPYPRFPFTLAGGEVQPILGELWGNAEVVLPTEAGNAALSNVLTGESFQVSREYRLRAADVFRKLPVALLVNREPKD